MNRTAFMWTWFFFLFFFSTDGSHCHVVAAEYVGKMSISVKEGDVYA